ncbi:conserved hypothetical protein [Haloferula helveola]|uniref:DUF3153 domain-containing protein n=1 Tax=Haloferula helveola TaxID=490095 RepID=A0ABN6H586_9BACT|nr:conserved hypothetical protein [Haloferula helveola]
MKRLLLLALSLLLSSCFDIREEIWIQADGGGRAMLDYTVPSAAMALVGGEAGMREEIDKLLAEAPDLRLDAFTVTPSDDGFRVHMEASTDSMLSLMDLQETEAFEDLPEAGKDLSGSFDVVVAGLDVKVSRRIEMGDALGPAALFIGSDDRDSRIMEYVIHLPTAAKEHNADEVTDRGKTLIWKRTLGQALRDPIVTRFRAKIPLPWWVIPAAIPIIALPAIALVRWIRRRKRA